MMWFFFVILGSMESFTVEVTFQEGQEGCVYLVQKEGWRFQAGSEAQVDW